MDALPSQAPPFIAACVRFLRSAIIYSQQLAVGVAQPDL
jgi:hypothetical protein